MATPKHTPRSGRMSARERWALWIAVAIAVFLALLGLLDVLEGNDGVIVVVMEVILPLAVAVLGAYAGLRDRGRREVPPPSTP